MLTYTTIAVAHKMKRQYIGIDKGKHIIDYVVPRQLLVLQGESMGILERVSDKNEGFNFYKLTDKQDPKKKNHS